MKKMDEKIIGIVGGMGPYTGLDLAAKVLDQTNARGAAEQPSLVVMACPSWINDRTDYLVHRQGENPAVGILDVIERLYGAGARVIGIPCNTAHAEEILAPVADGCAKRFANMTLVDMLQETGAFMKEFHPDISSAGLLCTLGSYKTNAYGAVLQDFGITVINPEGMQQQEVHQLIYDPGFGIKANPNRLVHITRTRIERVAIELKNAGAQSIILGCTEIPLVIKEHYLAGLPVIDPTLSLARGLLRKAAPGKLRPFPHESVETSI
ncbi:MAG: aspartate/glutamate racemase family protein [Candidatus Omnitrophica bacterium]|nr:aspartate/glutamate racemase family protein [Candidatus Omnitrophota bacterium]